MKKYEKTKKKGFVRNSTRRKLTRWLISALGLFFVLIGAGFLAVESVTTLDNTSASTEGLDPDRDRPKLEVTPLADPISAPDPPDLTLASFAYKSVAGELPGVEPEDALYVQRSVREPSWATVRFPAPDKKGEERYYAIFLQQSGDEWVAAKSVQMEDQDHPRNVRTLLTDLPEDLVNPMFPPEDPPTPADEPEERAVQVIEAAMEGDWESSEPISEDGFHKASVENGSGLSTEVYLRKNDDILEVSGIGPGLTSAEVPGFPASLAEPAFAASPETVRFDSTTPVYEGDSDNERVREGMSRALAEVQDYSGAAGFYVIDLESGSGYGIRPDESFFSASTIKVAVMAAVYRKLDEGELEYSDSFETIEEDFAAGAGWLQWETPGAPTTVEDALWLMMTQSDNVATNALTRLVGGPEYVNEVAKSLGAEDTRISWKVTSERAAVPALDNRATPRDMAVMLQKLHEGEAAGDYATREMIGLMEQNDLEFWMEAGIPQDIEVANKGGWLDASYNDVGIVEYEGRPYVLAVFTKYGQDMDEGEKILADISEAVWLAQSGKTKDEFEEEREQEREEQMREEQEEAEEERQESQTSDGD